MTPRELNRDVKFILPPQLLTRVLTIAAFTTPGGHRYAAQICPATFDTGELWLEQLAGFGREFQSILDMVARWIRVGIWSGHLYMLNSSVGSFSLDGREYSDRDR
jgi:hypothetical protein